MKSLKNNGASWHRGISCFRLWIHLLLEYIQFCYSQDLQTFANYSVSNSSWDVVVLHYNYIPGHSGISSGFLNHLSTYLRLHDLKQWLVWLRPLCETDVQYKNCKSCQVYSSNFQSEYVFTLDIRPDNLKVTYHAIFRQQHRSQIYTNI